MEDSNIQKKKACRGETLAETLVALLIMTVGFIMLPGALAASARINAAMEEENKQTLQCSMSMENMETKEITVSWTDGDTVTEASGNVNYYSEGDYYYYRLP